MQVRRAEESQSISSEKKKSKIDFCLRKFDYRYKILTQF